MAGPLTPKRTVTLERGAPRAASQLQLYLTLAFRPGAPTSPGTRFTLPRDRPCEIGRGARVSLSEDGGRLEIDDETISAPHFAVERRDKTWFLVDRGSKNGTLLNGGAAGEDALSDGDVIAAGRSFFVVRVAPGAAEPRVLDGRALGERLPRGLATLHPELAARFDRLERVVQTSQPILVLGETGTGKELVASAIHERSRRRGAYLAVSCAAVPEDLLPGELFGVKRGAYSGAVQDRPGLVRSAAGGTLFLDEIAELGAASQVVLLRVLQQREVLALGDTRPESVDVRFVAATHQNLALRSKMGKFREDLLARLAGHTVRLLPLRERMEDLGLLVAAILEEPEAPRGVSFSLEAAHALFACDFPRNVRQLRHAILDAALAADGPIEAHHLALESSEGEDGAAAGEEAAPSGRADRLDRARLEQLIAAHDGNLNAVARALATSRSQVVRLATRFGIDLSRRKGGS